MADRIVSGNGRSVLIAQDDGNLVLYHDGTPVWATMTVFDPTPPTPPDPPPGGDLPRLVVDGQYFRKADGARFTAIECSDFNLLNRWQHGEDIAPQLAQRARLGFNLLRVWTLYQNPTIGTFLDLDYARVPAFLALCASYGLYVELTAYTSIERKEHWDRLRGAVRGASNVLLELVNEGEQPVNAIDWSRYVRDPDTLCSHGSCSSETEPSWEPWDYVTFHTNGQSEEQRKIGHNVMEWADKYRRPALTNETSRYPEVGMWVGADADRQKQLAYDSAAGAALLCAGACFHSVQGKASVVFDAATERVARAWVDGALSVSTTCQPLPYRRRDDLLTPELLRVYQRGDSGCLAYIYK